MNKYNVGIEDIMSKITELNVYENYMEDYDKEVSYEEPTFIDEMVKITPSEAESLLDEIGKNPSEQILRRREQTKKYIMWR